MKVYSGSSFRLLTLISVRDDCYKHGIEFSSIQELFNVWSNFSLENHQEFLEHNTLNIMGFVAFCNRISKNEERVNLFKLC